MLHLGGVPASSTLYIPFETVDGTGAGVTISGFAVGDIKIYKNGSTTERASTSGFALLDTDGIDFDGVTGLHGFSIDLSDNSDAGFYSVGAQYWVVLNTITLSGVAITPLTATFRIIAAEAVTGKPKVDVDAFGGSAGTFSGGRPEVNTTHAAGTAWNSGAIGAATLAADTITAAKVADGTIDAATFAAGAINAAAIAADAITDAKVASDVTIASVTGSVGSVTGNVGGNVTGSVGSIATGGITSGSFAAGAIDNAAIATDAIGSAELAASAVTEIQSGLSTLDAAGVRSAVGLASANLDIQLDALPTTAEVNAEVDTALSDAGVTSVRMAHLDADVSSRLASGSYTAPPSAATIAQAVWDALTSALTTVGSIGKLLATNIDAAVSSRLAGGSYTAPDNAGIAAVKAKTDNLPDDPADESLIVAATDAIFGRLGAPAGASIAADVAAIKGDTAAVKTKTDSLGFTVSGKVDANVTHVNEVAVTGSGTGGDPWGPA